MLEAGEEAGWMDLRGIYDHEKSKFNLAPVLALKGKGAHAFICGIFRSAEKSSGLSIVSF